MADFDRITLRDQVLGRPPVHLMLRDGRLCVEFENGVTHIIAGRQGLTAEQVRQQRLRNRVQIDA